MTDWASLHDHIRERFTLQDDAADYFSTVYTYADERSQLVVVSRAMIDEREWLEIRSAICDVSEMDPAAALAQNAQFIVGAIAIDNGRYDMRHSLLLADASNEGVELLMALISAAADNCEERETGRDVE